MTRKLVINLLVGAIFAAATFGLWALSNIPKPEPPWPSQISGMSFSPLRLGNDPVVGKYPTHAEIESDLALLAGKVRSIRTYSVGGTLADIPELARKHQMPVTAGGWISNIRENNERELTKLIDVVKKNKNITRVIVGNEALLRAEVTIEEMCAYLDRIKAATNLPVSTAEPWHVWLKHPELVRHVDFIASHMLPYWEGILMEDAVGYVVKNYNDLKAAFPGKKVMFAEVGWPSNGRTRKSSVASDAAEATFLRRFLAIAEREKYEYFLMEAFDQTWKTDQEGAVGAYWGVYDSDRKQKFAFTEPIVRLPHWQTLAGATIILGMVTLTMLLLDSSTLDGRGRGFLAATAHGVAAGIVWVCYDYSNQYLTPFTTAVGIALAFSFLGIILVLLTEAHEMAEASWVENRRRAFGPALPSGDGAPTFMPRVSIHVPAYNEPPAMMIETLNALAKLDYPDFEVLVIDNNTKDPAVWQPVEEHCKTLGDRFRFFHVDPLKGFKAGALNFAIREMDPSAEVIAVIDSDYQVKSNWLKDLVPHFANPKIGIVQAPQDYRDENESLFKAMCFAEYKGFFHIGMVTRNERNAIIEHGTMTLMRAKILRDVGGWSEWCITEDAELGLRIFEEGYEAGYIENSYGKGLMPDTFLDYKKQRFRWAYGAVIIMRRHLRELLGRKKTALTWGQRYHFFAGWLPWLADGINLFYTLGALIWSVAIFIAPKKVDPPMAMFMVPPLLLFSFKVTKILMLYRKRVGASRFQTASAALAGLALSHCVAKSVLTGFLTTKLPFFRTPKCENKPALIRAFVHAGEESALAVALWLASAGVAWAQGRFFPGSLFWAAVLLVQSLPYVAALCMSLISSLPARQRVASESPPQTVVSSPA